MECYEEDRRQKKSIVLTISRGPAMTEVRSHERSANSVVEKQPPALGLFRWGIGAVRSSMSAWGDKISRSFVDMLRSPPIYLLRVH